MRRVRRLNLLKQTPMKHLIIIGARGYGREIYNAFMRNFSPEEWDCKGFLDSNKEALDGYRGYPPILCSPEDYTVQADDYFFCAMGDVRWRKHYADILLAKGGKFLTIIEKSAVIERNTVLGQGCYVGRNVFLSCDISIGDFVSFFQCAVLGHDVKVGDFCHFGAHTYAGGFSVLQNFVTVHPGAGIIPHRTLREGAVLGAGSVAARNITANTSVMGVPAFKLLTPSLKK